MSRKVGCTNTVEHNEKISIGQKKSYELGRKKYRLGKAWKKKNVARNNLVSFI